MRSSGRSWANTRCVAQTQGRYDALKLSDFHSRREFHRLEVYADYFRPSGIEFELEVALPSPPSHTRTFLFDDARHDFGERERALLNLLQPHLLHFTTQPPCAAVARSRGDSSTRQPIHLARASSCLKRLVRWSRSENERASG